MEEQKIKKCRNCTYELKKGIRRCPYCGILNPTLDTIDVFKYIIAILMIMALYTYLIK
jgi:RNA polymerase subunit RPABC4/transcription elongation factor Spt4